MKTPTESIVLVFLSAFLGSFGAVFLKSGASRLHRDLRTVFFNWRLALGVAVYLFSSYFFVLGVRKGELSVLYPMISLGYLWTLLWSKLFFKEPLTRQKLMGLALIIVGVTILNFHNR